MKTYMKNTAIVMYWDMRKERIMRNGLMNADSCCSKRIRHTRHV